MCNAVVANYLQHNLDILFFCIITVLVQMLMTSVLTGFLNLEKCCT